MRFPETLDTEASKLLLNCFGSKPIDVRIGDWECGHWASREQKEMFLVWKVVMVAKADQPARLVIALTEDDYQAFNFDPFAVEAGGFFEFAASFIENPQHNVQCPPATGKLPPARSDLSLSSEEKEMIARIVTPLLKGQSQILKLPSADAQVRRLMELAFAALPGEKRKACTLFTFAFCNGSDLDWAKPALAAVCLRQRDPTAWKLDLPTTPLEDARQLVEQLYARGAATEMPAAVAAQPKPSPTITAATKPSEPAAVRGDIIRSNELKALDLKISQLISANKTLQGDVGILDQKIADLDRMSRNPRDNDRLEDLARSIKRLEEALATMKTSASQPPAGKKEPATGKTAQLQHDLDALITEFKKLEDSVAGLKTERQKPVYAKPRLGTYWWTAAAAVVVTAGLSKFVPVPIPNKLQADVKDAAKSAREAKSHQENAHTYAQHAANYAANASNEVHGLDTRISNAWQTDNTRLQSLKTWLTSVEPLTNQVVEAVSKANNAAFTAANRVSEARSYSETAKEDMEGAREAYQDVVKALASSNNIQQSDKLKTLKGISKRLNNRCKECKHLLDKHKKSKNNQDADAAQQELGGIKEQLKSVDDDDLKKASSSIEEHKTVDFSDVVSKLEQLEERLDNLTPKLIDMIPNP